MPRRMPQKVVGDQVVEAIGAERQEQPRIVLRQAVEQAIEVHVGVDVEPLGRRQPAVPHEDRVDLPVPHLSAAPHGVERGTDSLGRRDQIPEELLRPPQIRLAPAHRASCRDARLGPPAASVGEAPAARGRSAAPSVASWSARARSDSASSRSNGGIQSSHSTRVLTAPYLRSASV